MLRKSFIMAIIIVALLAGTAMAVKLIIKDKSGLVIDWYTVSDNIEITVDTDTTFSVPVEPEPVAPDPTVSGEPPGVTTLVSGIPIRNVSVPAYGTKWYKFNVPSSYIGDEHGIQVLMGTYDWVTNQDLMISYGLPYPTPEDYNHSLWNVNYNAIMVNGSLRWSSIYKGGSDEFIQIYPNNYSGYFYVMVHNTSSIEGKFELIITIW